MAYSVVFNHVTITPTAGQRDVNLEGDAVTLTGAVRTWMQRDAAERAPAALQASRA